DTNTVKLIPFLQPEGLRSPLNFTFDSTGVRDAFSGILLSRGDSLVNLGASILTGPGGTVSLGGDTVAVLGSIIAPGGSISVNGATDSSLLFSTQGGALPTVDLGPESFLSVAGTTVLVPSALGLRTGSVLAGGSISVGGNIVAERG